MNEQTHPYSRKWFIESFISSLSPHNWKPNEITKCLYAVAEKYIREKRMSDPHVQSSNLFLTQYLLEILELSHETAIFLRDEEHTLFIENVRLIPPVETQAKTNVAFRLLPEQCNKRSMSYSLNIVVDVVYKVYTCKIEYPSSDMTPEEKTKFEKDWLKMRDLYKKEVGKRKYYEQYKPEESRIVDVLKDLSLGLLPNILGNLLCHLQSPLLQPGEGLHEPFGVFCVGGTYRIISPLKDLVINQDFVDTDEKSKLITLEVWSTSEQKLHFSTHTIFMYYDTKLDKAKRCKREITIQLPFSKCTLDITIIFLALGFTPEDMIWTVRMAARKQWRDSYGETLNIIAQNCPIKTQEEAFLSIAEVEGKVLTLSKAYLIKSSKIKLNQQLLPRLGQTSSANTAKARWLGYLIWRLFMHAENHRLLDPITKETHVVLEDKQFQIPSWMKVQKSGDQRQKKKHRDHLANCRCDFHGVLLASLFRQIFGFNWKQVKSHLQATLNGNKPVILKNFFKNIRKISSRIQYCITTGRWSSAKDKDCRKNVSQAFSMFSSIAQESHLTYLSTAMNSDGKNTAPRQINDSHFLNLDPAETPETKKCGLTGHVAQDEENCMGSKARDTEKTLQFYDEELYFIPDFRWVEIYVLGQGDQSSFDPYTQIVLNGKPIGYTLYADRFLRFFLQLRRTLTIDPFVSIYYDTALDIISIRTERGRLTVPFMIFPRLHHLLKRLPENYRESNVSPLHISALSGSSFHAPAFIGPRSMLGLSIKYKPVPEDPDLGREREAMRSVLSWNTLHTFSMSYLMGAGLIDFLDSAERKMTVIAMQEDDYWDRKERGQLIFTHIALDPHFMFSVTSGLTPLPDHNQSPRNTYMAAMTKATVEMLTNKYMQLKTKYDLMYSQVPFSRTLSNCYRSERHTSSSTELICALIPYFGYSVEDAQNMSKAATERGVGCSWIIKTYRAEHKQKKSSSSREAFGKPKQEDCVSLQYANYNKITEDGIPLVGTKLTSGDVVIGQTIHFRPPIGPNVTNAQKMLALKKKRKDKSIVYQHDEDGIVISSIVGTNVDGTQFARVQVMVLRYEEKGNKGSTRGAQKGTISYLFSPEDAPEVANGTGLIMEHLCNPQAVPKRMTIAMPLEQSHSLAVALGHTRYCDATGFRNQVKKNEHIQELENTLKRNGYSFKGDILRDGKTGQEIQGLIYFGVIAYDKLKHFVKDKTHARAIGPTNALSHQATEGRSKGGGLRTGEMERLSIQAYQACLILKQQMRELSDDYKFPVCMRCRWFATKHRYDPKPYCQNCKGRNILWVEACYAFKLLNQELFSTMVLLRSEVEPIDNRLKHLFAAIKYTDLFH